MTMREKALNLAGVRKKRRNFRYALFQLSADPGGQFFCG